MGKKLKQVFISIEFKMHNEKSKIKTYPNYLPIPSLGEKITMNDCAGKVINVFYEIQGNVTYIEIITDNPRDRKPKTFLKSNLKEYTNRLYASHLLNKTL